MEINGRQVHFCAKYYVLGTTKCRKLLNIFIERNEEKPDLTVVMMNPGSASPKTPNNTYVIGDDENDLQITSSKDATLSRVSSLMTAFPQVKWIQVLNLSDIIQPTSINFYSLIDDLPCELQTHSIFCHQRDPELRNLINPGSPVLLAWGMSKRTEKLKEQAVNRLSVIGANILNDHDDRLSCYHPLARLVGNGWRVNAIRMFNKIF
jgi:hypothetical protein